MVTNNGGGGSEERSSGSKNSDGGGGGSDGEMKTTAVLKKGPWTAAEDATLREYVEKHGEGNWNAVQRNTGLARCGKSCRLRWANHLRPNLKKGAFSPEEERLILELHSKLGNKWARMAAQLPGRTDNEIKNYWNTRVKRRTRQGLPLYPHEIQGRTTTSPYHHHHYQNNNNNNITQTQNLLPTSSPYSPMLSPHQPHSPMLSPHQSPMLSPHHSPMLSPHQSNSPMLSPHQSNSPMLSPHQSNSPMLSPHNSSSPLSLFDANSHNSSTHFFTPLTPPPLTLPSNRYKRYRSPNVEFSLNPQPSSPLGQYEPSPLTHPMLSRMPSFSLGFPTFDINSSHLYQTQYKSDDGLVSSSGGLAFSTKPELPSSQLYQITMEGDTDTDNNNNNDLKRDMNVASRHGSGLLDDLLRESQTISFGGESRRRGGSMGSDQEKVMFDGFLSHWDDSAGSIPSSSEMRSREGPAEQINFMHEDLSSILNIMPPTMKLPLWFSTSEDISNGQSSGGADILGIDVQQLTSSLPITTSNWDNMPGIC